MNTFKKSYLERSKKDYIYIKRVNEDTSEKIVYQLINPYEIACVIEQFEKNETNENIFYYHIYGKEMFI